ncbi:MAG: sensor domain-containing diguanylate cyclase [Campylobacterota bacterium]|nr:sensor domain-containing diguanylate cyclase [Campylobacterota bacterium]
MINDNNRLKEFSYFLRVNRNDIIDRWLLNEQVGQIFIKHSIVVNSDDKTMFYDFFDCFISVMQWELTISECPIKMKFLKYLSMHNVIPSELFNLFIGLKNTISDIFYEEQVLSFGLYKDLEKVSLEIANELSLNYEQILKDETNFVNDHSNLLNEYKKAVDISSILSKTNPKGLITYVNDKFCEVSGYSRSELIGKPHSLIRHPNMPSTVFKELWDTIKSKKAWNGIITNMKKDGRKYVVDSTIVPILDIDGDIVEYIALRHDVTEFEQTKEQLSTLNKAMKNKVDELYSMTVSLKEEASYDSLTGIFNRLRFNKFFNEETEKVKLKNSQLSMIILDIDHFKSINDNYGHHVGDEVLKMIASLVTKNLKRVDVFARWGGEEFVILLPGTDLQGATVLAENLRKIIEENSFSIAGKQTSSFGVGVYKPTELKNEFFERVDKLLYNAKRTGRNKVVCE